MLYDRDPRAAGQPASTTAFFGLARIGLNGIIGFSRYPLQLISWPGSCSRVRAFLLALVYLVLKLAGVELPDRQPDDRDPDLAASAASSCSRLGVMGEYVGRIYDEVKRRPQVIIESAHGIDRRTTPLLREDGVLDAGSP